MGKHARAAPYMVTVGRRVGSAGFTFPSGRVHIYIPTASIGTGPLIDTASGDNLANVGGAPTELTIGSDLFYLLTSSKRYVDAAVASRITDEFTALGIISTDDDTVQRVARYTLGTFGFNFILQGFSDIMQMQTGLQLGQRSISPAVGTPVDMVLVVGNSGWKMFINGVVASSGSGVDDYTGAKGAGVYFGRNNESSTNSTNIYYGPFHVWSRALSDVEVETARRAAGRPAAA